MTTLNSYTEEQFNKLPRWAQTEIGVLKGKNEHLNKKLEQFNGQGETNTYIVEGMSKRPLPNNSIIGFVVGEEKFNNVSAFVRKDGTLDINANSRGGETLVILPRASNSFYLSFIKQS